MVDLSSSFFVSLGSSEKKKKNPLPTVSGDQAHGDENGHQGEEARVGFGVLTYTWPQALGALGDSWP